MKTMKLILRVILIISVITGGLVVYTTFIERNLLISRQYTIAKNKERKDNLRVVQFTDTQLGEYYNLDDLKRAVKKINSLKPDIVVFTGDLIDNASKYEDLSKVSKVLKEINAKVGKYAIYGNHDYGGGAVRYYKDIMKKGGFTLLVNSNTKVNFNGHIINILGSDDALMGKYNVQKTVRGIRDDEFNLLLLHEPDLIDKYSGYSIDLALSGHSHGGQVYIPFYGPIKKNLLAKKYNRGMFNLENERKTKLYVNTGLGNTKVPFRFLTIPEITVFDIQV